MKRKRQVRCANDLHFYDPDKHHACPYCARHVDATVDATVAAAPPRTGVGIGGDIPDTQVAWTEGGGDVGRGVTALPGRAAGRGPEGGTVGYWGQAAEGEPAAFARRLRPVVGWLVCVEGPARYRDHPLYMGRNTLGRDAESDVVVRGDEAISRRKQAVITYDPEAGTYFVTEGEGVNPTYLNGQALRQAVDLKRHDRIRIGKTTLLFVPLCGEDFRWEP